MVGRRRGPSLLSPASYLRHNAVRRGVWGGSTGWVVVGVFLCGPRIARRLFGRTEQVVATERLLPGQFVRIEALATPTRSERKSSRTATGRAAKRPE